MGSAGNYLRNLASVALGRQPRRPLLFSYYVTHRCPWDCAYCCDGAGRPFKQDRAGELSTDDAGRLVELLARECDHLDVTGGEPLVRGDLGEILARARSAGMRTVLNTKGAGLPDRPEVLERTDVLVLSLDSTDREQLAGIMGGHADGADAVLEAVRFAIAGRRRGGGSTVLSAVAMPGNLAAVREVLRLAIDNRLGFHLSPEIVGTAAHPELRGNAAYRELVAEVIAAKRRGAGVLGVEAYYRGIADLSEFECHPLLMPTIRPDGRLYYPCLESGWARVGVLEAGGYARALAASRRESPGWPDCSDRCHVFCHMALSLYQRRPLAALGELRNWRN
jgi:MoaA/NifB/PqqE/SkfB family radical SAM enzyme